MFDLTPVLFIVATLAAISIISGKVRIPYPILLVLAGLVMGFIPGLPVIELIPEVVFILFLPPLLYRAAWNTSWTDFKKSILPISRLAFGLVFFTTGAVAVAAHYYIPGMSWPVAFVLGAIVSPPDAVSATSIIKGMGLKKRVVTILEGESLVNDASALIAYKYAVAAVMSSGFVFWRAGIQFILVSAGGTIIGIIIGYIFAFIIKRIHNKPLVEGTLSLLIPFISYPVAEALETSGVLAVVSTGLVTSWLSPEIFSHQGRTLSTSVWDMVTFLLNGIIFILIGFQLFRIVQEMKEYKLSDLIHYGLIISAVTILIRLAFIAPAMFFSGLLNPKANQPKQNFDWKIVLVFSWTGMRGVVSLATALALPLVLDNGRHFPYRKLILFVTFVVILVTLIGQGLTLPYLIRFLNIKPEDNDNQESEENKLRLLIANSSLDFINDQVQGKGVSDSVVQQVRQLYELRSNWISGKGYDKINTGKNDLSFLQQVVNLQLTLTQFKRDLLLKLHKQGTFSDENIKKLERELDLDESRLRSKL